MLGKPSNKAGNNGRVMFVDTEKERKLLVFFKFLCLSVHYDDWPSIIIFHGYK